MKEALLVDSRGLREERVVARTVVFAALTLVMILAGACDVPVGTEKAALKQMLATCPAG